MSDSQNSAKLSINRDHFSAMKNISKSQINQIIADGE